MTGTGRSAHEVAKAAPPVTRRIRNVIGRREYPGCSAVFGTPANGIVGSMCASCRRPCEFQVTSERSGRQPGCRVPLMAMGMPAATK